MRRLLAALAFLLVAAGPAGAEIAVVSGGRVRLAVSGSFDQVCHSLGRVSVGVIQQPHAGALLVNTVVSYPNFPAFNTRSRCNTLRLPQTQVLYQSTPGYIGYDEATIEFIDPQGGVRRFHYAISVRPGVIVPRAALIAPSERRVPGRRSRVSGLHARVHVTSAPRVLAHPAPKVQERASRPSGLPKAEKPLSI